LPAGFGFNVFKGLKTWGKPADFWLRKVGEKVKVSLLPFPPESFELWII
jgi:hypothetical protein